MLELTTGWRLNNESNLGRWLGEENEEGETIADEEEEEEEEGKDERAERKWSRWRLKVRRVS